MSTVWLCLISVVSTAQNVPAPATEPQLRSYPPSGDRLRDLADRLDFNIGYASRYEWGMLEQAALYENITASEFNIVTPENSVKWSLVHPQPDTYDFADMDRLRDFADSNNMRMHGHPLTWYLQIPQWLETTPLDERREVMVDHIDTVVKRYADIIEVWDVVNEGLNYDGTGYRDNVYFAAMGAEYIDEAFRAARAADADATLLYNDFDIGWLNPKSDRAFELVTDLQDRGIPLDGVGMQMHIDHTFARAEGFSSNMQRVADRGLEIWITEFDVGVLQPSDYEQQSVVYEDIIRRCLMQPMCQAVQIWGIDDFHSWRPFFDPLPFNDDFRVKSAYYGMQRALMSQPVHPENCTLTGAMVTSGAVYADSRATEALALRCPAVPMANGFSSLSVRYTNPGVNSPELILRVGDQEIGRLMLAPTLGDEDGDFRTVAVSTQAVTGSTDLEIEFEGDMSDAAVDALLFSEPTGPLLGPDVPGEQEGEPSPSPGGSPSEGESGVRSGGGVIGVLLLTAGAVLLGRRRGRWSSARSID